LILLPVTGAANPLSFDSINFPPDGTPVTKYVQWNVPQDSIQPTQLYPRGCCVFAVAVSTNEPAPPAMSDIIANPAAYHFSDLNNRLASDNNVVRRNLNII
jgi:hypothetical protein